MSQYRGVFNIFRTYWRCYGGIKALLSSPYLHVSFVLAALMFPIWGSPGWWSYPLGVMPSILGFSLGGFAIWLAIGDERFRALIAGTRQDEPDTVCSPFMEMNATFIHFILMQFFAILLALIFAGLGPADGDVGFCLRGIWFFGYWVFIYAIFTAAAAAMAIFRNAELYDVYQTGKTKEASRDE